MAQQRFFPLFAGGKQKLSGDFDAFARDHAHLYAMDEVKRQYAIATFEVEKALDMANAHRADPWDDDDEPIEHAVLRELKQRKELIAKGDKLRKEVGRVLDIMEKYSNKVDAESTQIRKQISAHVAKILPETKEKLDKIDVQIQGELRRLHKRNEQLIAENAVLKAKPSNEMKEALEKFERKLGETDNAELKRLKQAEIAFLFEQGRWEAKKEGFEKDVRRLERELKDEKAAFQNLHNQAGKQLKQKALDVDSERRKTDEARSQRDTNQMELEKKTDELEKLKESQAASLKNWQMKTDNLNLESKKKQTKIEQLEASNKKLRTQLQGQIDALTNEKQTLEQAAVSKDAEIAKLERAASSKDAAIAKLNQKLAESTGNFDFARHRYQESSREYQQLETSQAHLHDRLENITNATCRKSNRINLLHGQNARLRRVVLDKNTLLAQRDNLISQMQVAGNELQREKRDAESSSAEWKKAAEDLDQEKQRLEKSASTLRQEKETLDIDVGTWQRKAGNLETEKAQLQSSVATWKDSSEQLDKEKVAWLDEKKKLKDENAKLGFSVESWKNEASKVKDENQKLTLSVQGLEKKTDSLTTDVASWKKSAEDFQTKNGSLTNDVDSWKKSAEDFQKKNGNLINEVDTWKKSAGDFQRANDALTKDVATWKQSAENLEKEKTAWQSEKKQMENAVQQLQTQLINEQAAWAEEKTTLEGSVTTWKNEAEVLEAEKIAWNTLKSDMESATASLITNLFESQSAWSESRDVLQLHLEGASSAAMEYGRKCDGLTIENTSQAQRIEYLDEELANTITAKDTAMRDLATMTNAKQVVEGNLVTRTNELNEARKNLTAMTKNRDEVVIARDNALRDLAVRRIDLNTRTTERDNAQRDLRATRIDLTARTREKNDLQTTLDEYAQELHFSQETNEDLQTKLTECGNMLQEARAARDDFEQKFEMAQSDVEYNLVEQRKLEAEHLLCGTKIDGNIYQSLRERFDKLVQAHSPCAKRFEDLKATEKDLRELQKKFAAYPDLEELKKLQEIQWQHSLDLWIHQDVHDQLKELHSSCPDKTTLDLMEALKSDHAKGLWIEKSIHDDLESRFKAMEIEHSSCLKEEVVRKLQSLQDSHDQGLWIAKGDHDLIQQQLDSMTTEHSTCPDKMAFGNLQSLQKSHDDGLWVAKGDHDLIREQLNTLNTEHSTCPDSIGNLQRELQQLKLSHGEDLCVGKSAVESEQKRLQDLYQGKADLLEEAQRQLEALKGHGNECVGKDAHIALQGQFKILADQHDKCLSLDEVQRLQREAQHIKCIDQATYDELASQNRQCADEIQELRNMATQHQECLSADETQQLRNFHDNHGDCTSRSSYDQVFNEHQQCGQKFADAEALRQEYSMFKDSHQNCDAVAEELDRLREEHRRCGQTSVAAAGSSAAGTFQIPSNPRSGLRVTIPGSPLPMYTSPYGGSASPGQSSSVAGTFSQYPSPYARTPSGQSSPSSGTFSRSQDSPGLFTHRSPVDFSPFGQRQASPGMGSMRVDGFQFPGTPRQQGASPSQSPTAFGTFGPPLQQPQPHVVQRQYSFLVNGDLATGPRTSTASPAMIQLADAQLREWDDRTNDKSHWSTKSKASHLRCVYTRVVAHLTKGQNPETPNVACAACIKKGLACVLIGNNGPVIVPLPASERAPGATPTSAGYFVKGK